MEVYDIVEAASSMLKEGTLVLHRSMRAHPKFKVYKVFCYNLYHMTSKGIKLLFSFEETKNTPVDDLLKIWNECDKLYLKRWTEWIMSDKFKAMTNGI